MNTEKPGRYVLYGGGVTRAIGPQMVLEEGSLDYELREVDELRGDHRKPDFLAINPAGYIPALITLDGYVLHEAAAIMLFLAEHHRMTWLVPQPSDENRGLFLSRLFFQTNDIQPSVRQYFKPADYTNNPADSAGIKARAEDQAMDRWQVYDRFLKNEGPFALGQQFSLADIHMTMWAAYGLARPDAVLNAFPAVRHCFDLTCERPKIRPLVDELQNKMMNWNGESEHDIRR